MEKRLETSSGGAFFFHSALDSLGVNEPECVGDGTAVSAAALASRLWSVYWLCVVGGGGGRVSARSRGEENEEKRNKKKGKTHSDGFARVRKPVFFLFSEQKRAQTHTHTHFHLADEPRENSNSTCQLKFPYLYRKTSVPQKSQLQPTDKHVASEQVRPERLSK